MQIQCTNARNYNITVGNNYEVLSETRDKFYITNDRGTAVSYAKGLFRVTDNSPIAARPRVTTRVNATTATPRPAPVVPPAPARRTETDRINSIVVRREGNNITVSFDNANLVGDTPVPRSTTRSIANHGFNSFSCGIAITSGYNSIWSGITALPNYNESDYEELRSAIIARTAEAIREYILSQSRAFTLASDVENHSEELLTAIGFEQVTEFMRNPNSQNNIAVWVLVHTAE